MLDAADQVIRASPAAYALGIVRAERLLVDDLVDLVQAVRRDGGIREVELELPRGPVGSSTLSVLARVAPLGSTHVLVLIEDQTEARRVDAIRRDFVANISHELKTPVGAMSLLAEALADAADDPEAVAGSPAGCSTSRSDCPSWSRTSSSCPGWRATTRSRTPSRSAWTTSSRTRSTAAG